MNRLLALFALTASSGVFAQSFNHSITSVSPSQWTAGGDNVIVRLTGQFLTNNETVTFDGSPISLQLNTSTEVRFLVPTSRLVNNTTSPRNVLITATSDSSPSTVAIGFTINPRARILPDVTNLPDAIVGTPYSTSITFSGGTPPLTQNCNANPSAPAPPGLSLSSSPGVCTISGTPTAAGNFSETFAVSDAAGVTVNRSYVLFVRAPSFSISTTALPSGTVGTPYSSAITATGGQGAITWSVLSGTPPPGVSLQASTSNTVNLAGNPTTAGTFNFTVGAVDSTNQSTQRNFSVTIAPAALTITTTSLPSGTVGVPYSTLISASGGGSAHAWSVSAGTLPPGLSLATSNAPSVALSGTPTTAGAFGFTIRVASGTSQATRAFSITIGTATLSITTTSLPDGVVGVAYTTTVSAVGGQGPYTWTLATGALPAGLTLTNSGGLSAAIIGTPTTAGAFSFAVRVQDSTGLSATAALAIAVTSGTSALTITTLSLPSGTVGVPYSILITSTGGVGEHAWGTTAGALPPGLSLAASTASAVLLNGTPTTEGIFNFTVRVVNGNREAVRSLAITIGSAALTITTATLPDGAAGVAYTAGITATGGQGPYLWSVSSGTLPAGLGLTSAGGPSAAIFGTPTTAAVSNFFIRVQDAGGLSATRAFSLTITGQGLSILTTSLPNGAARIAYPPARIEVSGGAPPYSFAISSGVLPGGLSLNTTTGVVSGTPAATGTSVFAVTVTDSQNATASRVYNLTITESVTTLPVGVVGVDYRYRVDIANAPRPYQCSLQAGVIPAGLSLTADCELAGRPTQPGSASLILQVRDVSGRTQTATYLLTIVPGLSLSPDAIDATSPNQDYSVTFTAAGGVAPLRLSAEAAPAGLSFNPATGVLSGRVAAAGSFVFRIVVTDSADNRFVREYTLVVTSALTISSPSTLPDGVLDADYVFTFAAAGGTPRYTFVLDGGSLPTGLQLDAAGRLSGRPASPGGLIFFVRVTDTARGSARGTFSLLVPMPDGTEGAAYNLRLLPPAGFPSACRASAGTLPPGVQLNGATCALSGAPSAAGSYEFYVQFGSGQQVVDVRQVVRIQPRLQLSPGAIPAGVLGGPYTVTFSASGGTGPYRYRVSAGSLPAGLTLDTATGQLSGSPRAVGAFRFTIEAADSNGRFPATASTAYELTIAPPTAPSSRIVVPAGPGAPQSQANISVTLGEPYALPVNGQLTLTFAPNADNPADDPFISFANGSRTLSFTVPAGQTTAVFPIATPAVQLGTTAGTITINGTLQAGGVTLTPAPAPQTIVIPRSAPVISAVEVTRSASGITVVVTGFAPSRSNTSARFRFTAAAGANLQTSELTVTTTDLFNTWFRGSQSTQFGSQFRYSQVFNIQGDSSQVRSVEVTLTNADGTSQPVRRDF